VADEATRILQEAGITVIRSNANRRKYSVVDLALSIHFDGCATQCGSGASIGYDDDTDKPTAELSPKPNNMIFNISMLIISKIKKGEQNAPLNHILSFSFWYILVY